VVGRRDLVEQLAGQVRPSANDDACQKTVVEGLGGVGKTQLALGVAYRIRKEHPACSVFWVSAVSAATVEYAYRNIGNAPELPGFDNDKADVKDRGVDLRGCLPSSRHDYDVLTTRFQQVALELDMPTRNVLCVAEMSEIEATEILQTPLSDKQMRDT
ncbi:hypothetical protein JX266_014452, partial [Neoarthrinium moseri]